MNVDEAGLVFTDPKAYADLARFHASCALLRREAPVHRVEAPNYNPFWAVTKYDDVMDIERAPDRWINEPRPALGPKAADDTRADGGLPIRSLVQMDAPDHTAYRRISVEWFKPRSIARLNERAAELAKRSVDHMADLGGSCDFLTDVALNYPLYIILSLLGLPEEDFPRMLKLTQELFGSTDPELKRPDKDALMAALTDFFEYFQGLIDDRRAHPRDDLASVIANAEVNGAPIGVLEAVGYYVIIATAGHDTTSSAIAGGMHALLEHPEQLAILQGDNTAVPTAVDEMIRWVSPVKQFMRTATEDSIVRGVPIAAGESVLLSYPSANRDEDIFDRPDVFDVRRDPNRHVGFGFGAHYCLGTHLARMEAKAFYDELMPRLKSIELDGTPSYMQSIFVGGPKHLPVRYEFR